MTPDYEAYMRSEEWKTLKEQHPDQRKCVACDSWYNLRLHHMVYPPDIWKTQAHHCCWLCEGCHEAFHRACVGERAKYKAWATDSARVAMIVRAQRREEEKQTVGGVLSTLVGRMKVIGGMKR